MLDGSKQPAEQGRWGSGDYGNVSLTFYPFPEHVKAKKGVGVGLNGVQFIRKGEPLGRPSADNDFEVEVADDDVPL